MKIGIIGAGNIGRVLALRWVEHGHEVLIGNSRGPDTLGEVARETKEYLQERLRSARWLVKSIFQRQQTILKVANSIVKFQRPFFEHGVGHLKPLVLKDQGSFFVGGETKTIPAPAGRGPGPAGARD